MSFNVTFDATVNAQQQAAVQSVANFFNAHFTDPISVDIAVSFANLGPNGLGASSYSPQYPDICINYYRAHQ